MLIVEFYPKLKIKFSKQEANVLFAISQMGIKKHYSFTTAALKDKYATIFDQELSIQALENSAKVLIDLKVLKRKAAQTYTLQESIKNLNRRAN